MNFTTEKAKKGSVKRFEWDRTSVEIKYNIYTVKNLDLKRQWESWEAIEIRFWFRKPEYFKSWYDGPLFFIHFGFFSIGMYGNTGNHRDLEC